MSTFVTACFMVCVGVGAVACDKRARCVEWSGSDGSLLSVGTLSKCTDGKSREIQCARPSQSAPYTCSCVEDGTVSRKFERKDPVPRGAEALATLGRQECSWSVE